MQVKLHVQTDHADDLSLSLRKLVAHVAILQVGKIARVERLAIDVTRVPGSETPAGDMETISTELILADLQTIDNALPRLEKDTKRKVIDAAILPEVLKAKELLESEAPSSRVLTSYCVLPQRRAEKGNKIPYDSYKGTNSIYQILLTSQRLHLLK